MRLWSVLCLGGIRGVSLGQAVGRLRALVVAVDAVMVVEGPLLCAGRVRVEERASNFLLFVAGLIRVLVVSVGRAFGLGWIRGIQVREGRRSCLPRVLLGRP